MLKELKLTNVGPSAQMELSFAPRLNILTGDNGLGKSFLLDTAWWALTRKWPAEVNKKLPSGLIARPIGKEKATISFTLEAKTTTPTFESTFDRKVEAWTGKAGRPANPGLVLYAMVDGSFAVWDPSRNYWKTVKNVDVQDRPPAYVFTPREIWDGMRDDAGKPLNNGLVADLAGWQKEKGTSLETMQSVLKALSPSSDEPLELGSLTRISIDDPRDYPTLKMPYGQSIPVVHTSAGVRRVLALSYLLVWAWQEHVEASKLTGLDQASQVTFLIDEIEAHLHPKWQRVIVRSVLEVVNKLAPQANVQLITGTHSPLVLASVETIFSEDKDAWFDLDLLKNAGNSKEVVLTKRPFIRRGDVSRWLMSEAFDLGSGYSEEAETALREASEALANEGIGAEQAKLLDDRLKEVLSDTDPFWMRWRFVAEKRGWL
jgi:hypothetical protein